MKVCLPDAARGVEDEEDVLELAGALDLSSVARAVLREVERCWVHGKRFGVEG